MIWERIIAKRSKSSKYVRETVSNLGAKLWDILSVNIKMDIVRISSKNKILDSDKLPVNYVRHI